MKIEGPNPLRGRAIRKSKSGAPSAADGFAGAMGETEEAAAAPSGVTGTGPIQSMESLLALQGPDDPGDRRGRARARGEALLDRLEMLRADILLGRISRQRLDELSTLARTGRVEVDDPELAAVLEEIELRAAVELAKLDAER